MSRTRRYQMLYALALALLAGLAALIYAWKGLAGLAALAVLLLVPGRLGSVYLRNLFLSRKRFQQERFEDAIDAGETFLADLKRQPWRRHFIYCHYAFYTWDAEAMAMNNIGAARLALGEIDQAERHLRDALARDPDYPLPYVNLAVIAHVRGDAAEGDRLISIAAGKGWSGGPIDQAIAKVAAAYAHAQAQG